MKISQDQKFQQWWEFRGRDGEMDSLGDDSKSSSSGELVLKKHKLVSNLILQENDETTDTPIHEQKGLLDPGMGLHFEFGKASRTHIGLRKKIDSIQNKTKRGSMKGGNKKKSKCTQEPVSLDNFKIFAKSILEELKVARENMFARMREEMKKMVDVESALRPTSGERSVIRNRTTDTNLSYKVLEEPVNHDQAIEMITSNDKDKGERSRLSVKKSIYSSNHSDPTYSSSYLTLPSVISEPLVEHNTIDSSLRDCIQPGMAANDTSVNFERSNLMTDAAINHGYFSGLQAEEPFGSFARMGSKNLGGYDQDSSQTSSMGTAFPVPLRRRLDNRFNIQSQVVMENSSRDKNIMGLRMNGGAIRFSGGSHTLSDHFVATNFRGRLNYKTDGGLMPFGTQDLKDGQLYQN